MDQVYLTAVRIVLTFALPVMAICVLAGILVSLLEKFTSIQDRSLTLAARFAAVTLGVSIVGFECWAMCQDLLREVLK